MALDAVAIIAGLAPAIAASPALPVFLEMAREQTARDFYGTLYPYAVAYRALHLYDTAGAGIESGSDLAVIDKAGKGAALASMSEGGLSVSFAQNTGQAVSNSADLGGTKWGRMLLDLWKTRPSTGVNRAGLPPGVYL
jgi:hypothetical protein